MKSLFQALDSTADGAFMVDNEQRIIYWNQAARKILGYTYKEIAGQSCQKTLAGRDEKHRLICRDYCRVVMTALAGRTVQNFNICVHNKTGDVRWINMSTLLISSDSNGNDSVLVHLFRDITREKQGEQFIEHVLEATKCLQSGDFLRTIPLASEGTQVTDLTNREREVLSLLAQGHVAREIAALLSISPATVRNHIRNIRQKLQVRSQLEAVIYAFTHRLVPRD
jgi:PAS domain S-box-containing protein